MRTVVLRVVALALLLLLALSGVLTMRTLQRLPDTGLYLIRADASSFTLEKVGRTLGADDRTAWARAAVDALAAPVAGREAEAGLRTAVPEGTRVRDAWFDDGRLTVDLTVEVTQGGGSASMTGRLYQLLFTLTEPSYVDEVSLRVEGAPLRWLGGEGIEVPNPWRRPTASPLPRW